MTDQLRNTTRASLRRSGATARRAPVLQPLGRGSRPPRTGVGQRRAALAMVVLALLLAAATALSLRAPAAQSVAAPAAAFSAERAVAQLGGIAAVPHPAGTPAAAAVRTHLVTQLRALGLQPEVQTRVVTQAPDGELPTVGTVSNVHARISGTQPTGRVVLVAHYDSVPTGPGAADNGSNVAAILEVARALLAGPPPRNDVDVLFTDAEELGLLGARAFVDSGVAGDPGQVVVVNLEARGVSGPAVMFQMAGTGLAPAVQAANPVTTSFAAAVYEVLPNDTDLTAFALAGMRGVNFAFLDGAAHYHTPHDDIARLDPASVQDMGDAALGAVRQLGGADLAEPPGPGETWFSLLGTVVVYPAWLDLLLAAVAVAGYVLLLRAGRRHGVRLRGVGRATTSAVAALPTAVVIGAGGWWLLTLARPELRLTTGALHRPGPYLAAEVVLLLAAVIAWYRWARRRTSPDEVAAGVLGWFVLLAVLALVLLPGGAYLFVWPALVGVAALATALRCTDRDSPLRAVARCAAALPAVALLLPVVLLLVPALGLALSPVPLLLAGLLLAALATGLEPLPRRRRLTLATAGLVVLAVAGAGVGAALDDYDADHPRAVSLAYVLEADARRAGWISLGGPDQPGVGPYLTGDQVVYGDRLPPMGDMPLHSGPAPVTDTTTGATVDLVDRSGTAAGQDVRVRIRVPTGVYLLEVYPGAPAHAVLGATVDGVELAGDRDPAAQEAANGRWGFRYVAPPVDGVDVTLRLAGPGPVPIQVVAIAGGLPPDVGAPALAPDLSWTPWPVLPAETYVVRTTTV